MENLVYSRGLHEGIDKIIPILQMRKLAQRDNGTCSFAEVGPEFILPDSQSCAFPSPPSAAFSVPKYDLGLPLSFYSGQGK